MISWLLRIENRELYTQFLSDQISLEEVKKIYNNK